MPPNFFALYNHNDQTPWEVFHATHKDLAKDASEWLSKTCESSSIIAVLVASVAYATASTVPGGVKAESGEPTLKDKPPFIAFAVSSLVALCSSITALVVFLSIIMSQRRYEDLISPNMPRKLLLAFTSLSASVIAMLASFFGGQTFVLKDELRDGDGGGWRADGSSPCREGEIEAGSRGGKEVELVRVGKRKWRQVCAAEGGGGRIAPVRARGGWFTRGRFGRMAGWVQSHDDLAIQEIRHCKFGVKELRLKHDGARVSDPRRVGVGGCCS
ncbi:hypothetical protein TIFTF001_048412 [Ficus carica]|uniref:PGG domain-containing protein n=1 Tax=Ficus carica TaxID=3494 RepID=A0AA88A0B1_FICCA|nr:hypothetical protein TIFTF001_048412 [Ficus carica]